MQKYEEAVLKTVTWWSDKSFRAFMNQNNGEIKTKIGETLHKLMNTASMAAQSKITPDQIKVFEARLTEQLMEAQDQKPIFLDVDYHPCQMLADAAEKAGIDVACFPCKSFTRIDKENRTFAKFQYGAIGAEI